MGQRNDPEVRPVRAQAHRGDDIFRVGHELFRRESNESRRAAGGGGGFEMDTILRGQDDELVREDARDLSGFQRTDDFIFTPGGEQIEDKFRRVALRKDRAGRANVFLFTSDEKFLKRPALAGSKIAQRKFVAPFRRKFSATVRKALSVW